MPRTAFITALLTSTLAIAAAAQVAVNGGYATTIPSGAPSVPAITTPTAHVGPEATPENAPGYSGPAVVQIPSEIVQRPAEQVQNQQQTTAAPATAPFNFGVAQYDSGVTAGDLGQPLGETARLMRQRAQAAHAKTFTNADIQRMDSSSGTVSGIPNQANDQWPDNNGVISPEPANSAQQPPAPNANPAASGSPFAPKGYTAQPSDNNAAPQAFAKPSASQPYLMAQNNPSNAGIPQSNATGNAAANPTDNTANNNADNQNASLPKTASRLPLLGVLGFFSIALGMFVRHQRAKTAK